MPAYLRCVGYMRLLAGRDAQVSKAGKAGGPKSAAMVYVIPAVIPTPLSGAHLIQIGSVATIPAKCADVRP